MLNVTSIVTWQQGQTRKDFQLVPPPQEVSSKQGNLTCRPPLVIEGQSLSQDGQEDSADRTKDVTPSI